MIKMYLLSENYARKRNMLAEHGLSILLEKDDKKILFDSGQSNIFAINAERMGIDISKVDMLILSHGHYDHTGGVLEFCRLNNTANIYIHPGAFKKRYYGKNEFRREIGIPWSVQRDPEINNTQERFLVKKGPISIDDNMIISGEILSTVQFENIPQDFYIEDVTGNLSKDMIIDEQMLIVKGKAGIYVFVGCSHAGVVNCIKHAQKYFPNEKIAGVIGGMHLNDVSDMRIHMTIQHLSEMDIKTIIPLHCTGIFSICEIKRVLKERCKILSVGDEFIFES